MKDFYSFDEFSIPLWVKALFWGFYMVVFVYAVWKLLIKAPRNKREVEVNYLIVLYFAAYAVFYCVNPDYFSYRAWLYGLDFTYWNKEVVYVDIILICRSLPVTYPYEVFRLIVWGGAVLLAYHTFRMYKEMALPGLVFLFLFVFHSSTFSYARASLAMAVYFFGISVHLCLKDPSLRIWGIIAAIFSFFLHREMLVGIAVLPCILIPFERKHMTRLSIIWLIIAVATITYFKSNFQIFDAMFDNDDISSKIESYNETAQGSFRLSTLVNYLKYFFPFYVITKCILKRTPPMPILGMYRITYAVIMSSAAFMIVFGLRSVYTYRVLYITMIPLTLLVGYCYCNGYFTKKQILILFILALLSNSTRFINA